MHKSNLHKVFYQANISLIIVFVIMVFCLDFLDKIEIFYGIDFLKFNRYLKAVIYVYSIGFILMHLLYVWNKLRYLIYTVLVLSGIFALKHEYWHLYHQEFFRYCFILIFYPVLHYSFFQVRQQDYNEYFYIVIKTLISINLVAILIGLVFNVFIFQTYQFQRFGYNGILLSQGLTPYVYLAATVMFWTRKNNWMLVVTFIAAILSGVKGVYFGLFILLGLLILFDQRFSKIYKLKMVIICFVVFVGTLVVIFMTRTFREIIEKDGFVSAIFSYRLDNLLETIKTSPEESFNIFIGAIGIQTIRLELQLVDILLFFGMIGIVTYIYFIVSVYKDIVKSYSSKAFFIASLALSLLSGNLFYIPLAAILFFFTLFCLNQQSIRNENVVN